MSVFKTISMAFGLSIKYETTKKHILQTSMRIGQKPVGIFIYKTDRSVFQDFHLCTLG